MTASQLIMPILMLHSKFPGLGLLHINLGTPSAHILQGGIISLAATWLSFAALQSPLYPAGIASAQYSMDQVAGSMGPRAM